MAMLASQMVNNVPTANGDDRRGEAFGDLLALQQRQARCQHGRKDCVGSSKGARQSTSGRSRKFALVATSVVTLLALSLDTAILNGSSGMHTILDWVMGDSTLLFYFIGVVTAFIFYCPRAQSKKIRGTNGCCRDEAVAKRKMSAHRAFGASASSPSALDESSRTPGGATARLGQALNQAATQGKAERCAQLLSLLEAACATEKPDAVHYNQVIRAHARRGEIKHCERFLERMREHGPQPTEQSFVLIMSQHARNGNLEAAEAYMATMKQDGLQPGVLSYSLLIHGCGRIGDLRRGTEWLHQMTAAGVTPSIAVYNSLIHAAGVCNDALAAEQWFEDARSKGVQPTVTTYTTLIDVSAKTLDLERAERWMSEMLDRGIEPNVISYSSMINACAKVGDLQRAESWYANMQAHGVAANAYSYSALINSCSQIGDVEAACSWLSRAEGSGITLDTVVYGCVLNVCGRAGDAEKAAEVFAWMRARGVRTGVVVYSALARPFAYRGDWEEVERLRDAMTAEGVEGNDYFLYALLLSYSRARPRQGERAEKAFCKAVAEGMPLAGNERVMKALSASVGKARACEIAEICCA